MPASPPPPIAFIHIPRTSGSSLKTALRRCYGEDLCWLKLGGEFPPDGASWISPTAKIGGGHMNRGLHEFTSAPYATVLRDPIDGAGERFGQ